jgi:hypothetical protein
MNQKQLLVFISTRYLLRDISIREIYACQRFVYFNCRQYANKLYCDLLGYDHNLKLLLLAAYRLLFPKLQLYNQKTFGSFNDVHSRSTPNAKVGQNAARVANSTIK